MGSHVHITVLCDDTVPLGNGSTKPFEKTSYNDSFAWFIREAQLHGIDLDIGHHTGYQAGGLHSELWRIEDDQWSKSAGEVRAIFHKIVKGVDVWNERTIGEDIEEWPERGIQNLFLDKTLHYAAFRDVLNFAPMVMFPTIEDIGQQEFDSAIEELRDLTAGNSDFYSNRFWLKAAISGGSRDVIRRDVQFDGLSLPSGLSGTYLLQIGINNFEPSYPFESKARVDTHDFRRIFYGDAMIQAYFRQQGRQAPVQVRGLHSGSTGSKVICIDEWPEYLGDEGRAVCERLRELELDPDSFLWTVDGSFTPRKKLPVHELNTSIGQTYDPTNVKDTSYTQQLAKLYLEGLCRRFNKDNCYYTPHCGTTL